MNDESQSSVPLTFVDLMACGLGAMTLMLFTALLPLSSGVGDSDAVAVISITFEYPAPEAGQPTATKPAFELRIDPGDDLVRVYWSNEQLVTILNGQAVPNMHFDQNSVLVLGNEDDDPVVQASWQPFLSDDDKLPTWTWVVIYEYKSEVVPGELAFEFPSAEGRPARVAIQPYRIDGVPSETTRLDLATLPDNRPARFAVSVGPQFDVRNCDKIN